MHMPRNGRPPKFTGAVAFPSSITNLPVWAYEDYWDTVEASARIMLGVANDMETFSN